MATVHKPHEGSCGPCSLCMGTARKYTHVEKFSEDECALLLTVESTSIDPSACICYSCSKQIKRNATNPNFQPRWKPKMCQKTLKCSISKCDEQFSKSTRLASVEDIEQVLQQKVACFTVEDDHQVAVGLCRDHYNTLYTCLHSPQPCESCKIKPNKGQYFNRHCPSPDEVNTYLRRVSNYPSHLSKESLICLSCYKHFSIIANIKKEGINKYSSDLNREVECETHKQIDTVVIHLQSKVNQNKQMSETDTFELAMHKLGIRVGECMKCGVLPELLL